MSNEVRIIVAGGRDFHDADIMRRSVHQVLFEVKDKFPELEKDDVKFISGTCAGADKLGEIYASKYGYEIYKFPANWEKYGKSAGVRRNAEMAKFAAQENGILIAFWNGESRGTKSMIKLATKYGLDIHIINY